MPFNLKNAAENKKPPETPQPILHNPSTAGSTISRAALVIFIIAVFSAASFLIYKSGIFKGKEKVTVGTSTESALTISEAPASAQAQQFINPAISSGTGSPAVGAKKDSSPVDEKSHVRPQSGGGYTIYIGSFKSRENAEKEIKRLGTNSQQAMIIEKEGWYHVAFGRYATRDAASEEAEKRKDFFRSGYHIARLL